MDRQSGSYTVPVSERTYLQLALEDPNQWELHCGELQRKPTMTAEHNYVASKLFLRLKQQLDGERFDIRLGMGHVRRSPESYFIPDVFVVPSELVRPLRGRRDVLETYDAPLPLVVEVWSPSTGEYDVDSKLPEYKKRGDLEIWYVHPFDGAVTAWRRQPGGDYTEARYLRGIIQPVALPGVAIDLDELFA
jgi:Uma2 family endonuclease